MPVKVGLVSLGCAKNLIDSEIMIGHLAQAGMSMTPDAAEADVVIVNTCSFIDASKHEALEAIYEMSDGKATARKKGQKLIVAGCMAQRYQGALPVVEGAKGRVELPKVDAFIGLDQPMRAARRMTSSGPVPSATVASPIHARRRSLKRLRNGSGAGSVTAPRGYATGCAPSGDPNAGNSPD